MTVDQKSGLPNQPSLSEEAPGSSTLDLLQLVSDPTPGCRLENTCTVEANPETHALVAPSPAAPGANVPGAGKGGTEATVDAEAFGDGRDLERPAAPPEYLVSGGGGAGSPGTTNRLEPGTRVGRYLVLECIGEGAMGQVYAAFDPELDRKIALKIMNAGSELGSSRDSGSSSAARRLMREAKALSQLAHPNVVSVFDVGSLGNEIFVAMEFVAGTDLRRWGKENPRTWKEVLEVYLQAGQGLAAAHAAGLVHRDFKPHNAILGADGRVRVLDFGLATPSSASSHAKAAEELLDKPIARTASPASGHPDEWERLTLTGTVLGTPAYMAPEVIAGQGADEKSDQFSFAVSLFMGLYGCLPFSGGTLREIADSINAGRVAEMPGHRVPGWLRKVLLRGLSADPAKRYPSVQDMLTVLMRQDPASVRTRWAARLSAGVATVLLAAAGMVGVVERNAQVCRGAEQRLVGVWDQGRRKQVEGALLATGLTYAPDTWSRVKNGLDGYSRGWVAIHTEACQATHVRGEQSGEMLDLRMACLRERLGEVKALVDVLGKADTEILSRAVPAVHSLVPLSACADVESLRSAVAPPRDPEVRQQVERLRERLEQARALERTGKYADGMMVLEALEQESRPLGYQPLTAEVLLMKGILLSQRSKHMEATAALEEADLVASDVKHAEVSAQALNELVNVVGFQLRRFDEGLVRGRFATTFLRHAGLMDKWGDRLFNVLGLVMRRKGQFDKAIEYQTQAVNLCGKKMPAQQCHMYVRHLGAACYFAGRFEEAEQHMLRSIKDAEAVLGPTHPELAKAMNNFNLLLCDMGRFDEAMQWMERALQIYEQAYGKENALVSDVLNNIGNIHWWKMDYHQALSFHQRALDMRVKGLGMEHSSLASSHQNVASDYLELGNLVLAR